jgi:hypothetical protein
LAAPNTRAPTALAHSTRVPSIDHSHTGKELVACTASRGSPTLRNWNSALFIVVIDRQVWLLLDNGGTDAAVKKR